MFDGTKLKLAIDKGAICKANIFKSCGEEDTGPEGHVLKRSEGKQGPGNYQVIEFFVSNVLVLNNSVGFKACIGV